MVAPYRHARLFAAAPLIYIHPRCRAAYTETFSSSRSLAILAVMRHEEGAPAQLSRSGPGLRLRQSDDRQGSG